MSATTVAPTKGNAELVTFKSTTETTNKDGAANGATNAERQVPPWLKVELFVNLLQKNLPNFKSIKNFTAKLSEGVGENYATLLASVNLDAELEGK